MNKPWIHALSSAREFGGVPEDYIDIHNIMDYSKHRALTHNSWFIGTILEGVFGAVITNSSGIEVSVRDIGEQHVLEDLRDRLQELRKEQDSLSEKIQKLAEVLAKD